MKRREAFSAGTVVRVIVFSAVAALFLGLGAAGRLGSVIHPRMHPWIAVSGVLFLGLAVTEIAAEQRRRKKGGPPKEDKASYFYPLLAAFALTLLYIHITTFREDRPEAPLPAVTTFPPPPPGPAEESRIPKRKPQEPLPDPIVLEDEDYWERFNRIYDEAPALAGRKITVEGFVYRRPDFPPDTVLVSRYLMWCCAADIAMIGFLAQGPEAATLANGVWVEAGGTLETTAFDISESGSASTIPLLRIESLRPVPKKKTDTIYPN